jgi:hypothetical protein
MSWFVAASALSVFWAVIARKLRLVRKGGQPPITLEVVELPKFAKNVLNSTPEVPGKFH